MLDGADEERIEAIVAERVRTKLLNYMTTACDRGRQKVSHRSLTGA